MLNVNGVKSACMDIPLHDDISILPNKKKNCVFSVVKMSRRSWREQECRVTMKMLERTHPPDFWGETTQGVKGKNTILWFESLIN